ncbi:MAG: ABC transporter permease, partial [Anaerolineae bacterium]|nr:ABC transporter permease [Anaerolineae bacterium]
LLAGIAPWLLDTYGISLTLRPLNRTEWALLATVPAAAALVGLVPAFGTWRRTRTQGLGEITAQ